MTCQTVNSSSGCCSSHSGVNSRREINLHFEWNVEVPIPRNPPGNRSSLEHLDNVPGDLSTLSYPVTAAHCPLTSPDAFDWAPSLAALGDIGFEVYGLLVSFLDIVEVKRYNVSCSKTDVTPGVGLVSAHAMPLISPPSNVVHRDDCDASAVSAEDSHSSGDKENIQICSSDPDWEYYSVALRTQLPEAIPAPPLFSSPEGSSAEAGSSIIFRMKSPCGDRPSLRPSPDSPTSTDGQRALELLQKLEEFISNVRPVFCSIRRSASLAKRIREEFDEKRRRCALEISGGNATLDKSLAELALCEVASLEKAGRLSSLLCGFLLPDCAALEEAVAYAPLAMYVHAKEAPFLMVQLPVDPLVYPTWKQAVSLQRRPYNEAMERAFAPKDVCVPGVLKRNSGSSLTSRTSPCAGSGMPFVGDQSLPFRLHCGGCRLAKGERSCCEDAFFLLEVEGAFGVFDGVGSWAAEGIDASRFSEGLAAACAAEAKRALRPDALDPEYSRLDVNGRAQLLLQRAHEAVCKGGGETWGSSTAVVGVIDRRTGRLGVACLGDSSLMLLRRELLPASLNFQALQNPARSATQLLGTDGAGAPRLIRRCTWRSKEQRWSNGAPYQLCHLPPREDWESLRARGFERFVSVLENVDPQGDSANMADAPVHPLVLQPGDLLLLFSDGVADNLFDGELEAFASLAISPDEASILRQRCEGHKQPTPPSGGPSFTAAGDVAEFIVKVARRRASDYQYEKPFQLAKHTASAAGSGCYALSAFERLKGGKRDDISCVAVWVSAPNAFECTATQAPSEAAVHRKDAAAKGAATAEVSLPSEEDLGIRQNGPTELKAATAYATAEAVAQQPCSPHRRQSPLPQTPPSSPVPRRSEAPMSPASTVRAVKLPGSASPPSSSGIPLHERTPLRSRRPTPTFGSGSSPHPQSHSRVRTTSLVSPTSTPRKLKQNFAASSPPAPLPPTACSSVKELTSAPAAPGASQLPRPSFVALAALRAAASAGTASASSLVPSLTSPQRHVAQKTSSFAGSALSPRRAGCPRAAVPRVPSPQRHTNTPKKPLRASIGDSFPGGSGQLAQTSALGVPTNELGAAFDLKVKHTGPAKAAAVHSNANASDSRTGNVISIVEESKEMNGSKGVPPARPAESVEPVGLASRSAETQGAGARSPTLPSTTSSFPANSVHRTPRSAKEDSGNSKAAAISPLSAACDARGGRRRRGTGLSARRALPLRGAAKPSSRGQDVPPHLVPTPEAPTGASSTHSEVGKESGGATAANSLIPCLSGNVQGSKSNFVVDKPKGDTSHKANVSHKRRRLCGRTTRGK